MNQPLKDGILKRLKRGDYELLCCIAAYMDNVGRCFPSQSKLGLMIGETRQNINIRIKRLKETNLLRVFKLRTRGGKLANLYEIQPQSGIFMGTHNAPATASKASVTLPVKDSRHPMSTVDDTKNNQRRITNKNNDVSINKFNQIGKELQIQPHVARRLLETKPSEVSDFISVYESSPGFKDQINNAENPAGYVVNAIDRGIIARKKEENGRTRADYAALDTKAKEHFAKDTLAQKEKSKRSFKSLIKSRSRLGGIVSNQKMQ